MKSNKIGISILVVISFVLIAGMIYSNRASKNTVISDDIKEQDMDIEKELEKPNIPEIKANTNTKVEENKDVKDEKEIKNIENDETVEENKEDKIVVPEIPKPKKEKLPDEMEKPITQPKPKEPPKVVEKEIKQEKKEEVKGGTGDDGVVRDLKGNPTGLKPAEKIEEIKGSDLGNPNENMGEGDKF